MDTPAPGAGIGPARNDTNAAVDLGSADDAALARAAALGDRRAFAVIVDRHGPSMYRYARRMLPDAGDAQEVVQDAFVSAWKGLDHYAGRSTLRTWLFSLTAHKAVDLRRKKRLLPAADESLARRPAGPQSDPAALVERSQLLAGLDQALKQLPPRQRACWLLVEVEGMTQAEVAEVLTVSPGVVRGQLSRGRRALGERMQQWR